MVNVMVAGKVPKPFFYSNTYFDRSILPQFNEWFYKDPYWRTSYSHIYGIIGYHKNTLSVEL